MAGDLPFLPHEWRRIAEGIARDALGQPRVEDVRPEHRQHLIDCVGKAMQGLGVEPPENWRPALAQLCRWDSDDA